MSCDSKIQRASCSQGPVLGKKNCKTTLNPHRPNMPLDRNLSTFTSSGAAQMFLSHFKKIHGAKVFPRRTPGPLWLDGGLTGNCRTKWEPLVWRWGSGEAAHGYAVLDTNPTNFCLWNRSSMFLQTFLHFFILSRILPQTGRLSILHIQRIYFHKQVCISSGSRTRTN